MLLKQVTHAAGGLMTNYRMTPALIGVPALVFVMAFISLLLMRNAKCPGLTFITSGLAVAGIIATAGVSLFPFMLPSSSTPNDSLMVWDTSSSQLTLEIMLGAVLIFLPLILAYTSWVYHVLRGPVTVAAIERDIHTVY
jgi:cytochrome d ubiquinol oxidase subunit II